MGWDPFPLLRRRQPKKATPAANQNPRTSPMIIFFLPLLIRRQDVRRRFLQTALMDKKNLENLNPFPKSPYHTKARQQHDERELRGVEAGTPPGGRR